MRAQSVQDPERLDVDSEGQRQAIEALLRVDPDHGPVHRGNDQLLSGGQLRGRGQPVDPEQGVDADPGPGRHTLHCLALPHPAVGDRRQ
jgi:hypothetical protein